MTSLVADLGGTAGFGEFSLARNDDGSTGFIDLTPIFGAQGINFFGRYYTGFYLNNNGSVTFNAATSSFTPSAITGSTSNPVIAAYWADIDTRGGAVTPTPGGTSTGTNLLWYDLDALTQTFTATWDDVGYFSSQTNKLNAFQLGIHKINAQGDFDITFRYENIDWTTGNASGGSNGLGGTPARAGYSAGNGVEYFELTQSGNQGALLALESASNVGAAGTYVFAVRNGVPTVGVTAGDGSIDEGDGGEPNHLSIPVFLTEASTSTVTVHYTTANGTALAGQDYVAQSGTLTFAPGVVQQNILVAVTGDATVEGDETFTVTLSDPSDGASIIDGSATGTILNDDSNPASLSIAATSANKAEGQSGSSAFTFTVTRTGDLSGASSAQWAVAGAAVNAADFTGGVVPTGTVSFAAGEGSKVISIHVAGDTAVESNEAFSVTLSNASAGTVIGTASANGRIRNDDASLSIAATSADKAEGQSGSSAFTFTVTRTGDLSGAASAQWAVTGAAVNAADFTGGELPTGTVSFAAGEGSKVISIHVAGDTAVESNEAFSVTLSNASAGTVIGTASANGLIGNDDASLSIAATSADKAEGQSGSSAFTFTVTRTGDLSGAASAQWAVAGAAVNAADFTGGELPTGTVSFAAGEGSKVISIHVAGDTAVESNEAFSVTLSNASAGTVIGTASANGLIGNDDASLSIAATSADKAEGDMGATPFTFTVTRTGDLSGSTSVSWGVTGSDVFDADFIPSDELLGSADLLSQFASDLGPFFIQIPSEDDPELPAFSLFGGEMPAGTVSFSAGETSKTVTVWVLGETLVERDESFQVTLSDASEGAVIDTASAVGIIRNDERPDLVLSGVSYTLPGNVPNLLLIGTDDIDGTGNALSNILIGNAGHNTLSGLGGTDYMYGLEGDDILIGGAAGAAPNQLWGGEDTDTASYAGTTGAVYADVAAQAGYVDGALVDSMNSIENLTGGSGINTLVGDGDANVLTGGAGIDYLYGQGGDDVLIGGAVTPGSTNQLWGGHGSDTASYATTTGVVYADLGVQAGHVAGVLIDEMNSIENLVGGSNADTLVGDAGANRLTGGSGADVLWGRGGADVFVFSGHTDSNLVTGYDTIGDFVSGVSKLDLRAFATDASHVVIQSDGGSTSLYVLQSPGNFDTGTDAAMAFIGANAIAIGDILFS
ncbi:M10 family metallopeptidase C-terminal domain-containing protein [Reyranella sp. MMS21-HV4-11]|uniref:M10 family metallopeptidase C-terminal domain-containing protein n=1 Tax=Reyranella humidisoli TaxID=2849149 RepID=A0ABS6IHL2_9HYPH|nr:Calx-beta domain-containing protein [Reyranella sp. MMS21-HV4-11]MBU8874081.1 M10 family metallopeptidase C-terminal domain-containing protein [Reyranella sp. MMS21-HV4-11]